MKLSILLLSYNYKKYIKQCLDSILSQKTNFEFEVLVRDDGSNDGTYELIKENYSDDSRVVLLDSSQNLGVLDNILSLIEKSKGEYLCHIDADDYLIDFNYFQRAIDFLEKNQDYNIYSGGYKYQENDKIYPETTWMISPIKHITIEHLLQENYVSFCRIFRKIKVSKRIFKNMYPDWILNFECLKNNKKAYAESESYVGIYRIHSESMFSKKSYEEKEKINFLIKNELKKRYDDYKKNESYLNKFIFHVHLFLSNEKLEKMAYENLKNIKNQGFKILVTSPKKLPSHFYDIIDIFYHDKENQLLQNNYDNIEVLWHWTKCENMTLYFGVKEVQKHGLAVLRSMIKGCQLAKINEIQYVIRIEFDDLFGPDSFLKIKKQIEEIVENKIDFSLIRNIYQNYTDVSVHLMFYDCEKFLNIFGNIVDEKTFNDELVNLGIPKKSTMLETFIYLMIDFYSKNVTENFNIIYNDTEIIQKDYSDTYFNAHQNCFSLTEGILSDVNYVFENNILKKQICLATRNFSSENEKNVEFLIKYKNSDNTSIIQINTGGVGCWSIRFLDNVEEIDTIFIRNQNNVFDKKYKIITDNSNFTILNMQTNEASYSRIEYVS